MKKLWKSWVVIVSLCGCISGSCARQPYTVPDQWTGVGSVPDYMKEYPESRIDPEVFDMPERWTQDEGPDFDEGLFPDPRYQGE